jgi:hypothetical protein
MAVVTLSLLIVGALVPGPVLGSGSPYNIVLAPGASEFELGGEQFLIVTTQEIRVSFDTISPSRVNGWIRSTSGQPLGLIKFIWLTHADYPLPLSNEDLVITSHEYRFDSQDVTGHNEKAQ